MKLAMVIVKQTQALGRIAGEKWLKLSIDWRSTTSVAGEIVEIIIFGVRSYISQSESTARYGEKWSVML